MGEKEAIKRRLEALEDKQQHAAVARIQARFRGLKDRALNKGRFAAVVDVKVAREKENELRREQDRLLEQQKQQEEEERLARCRAEEKAAIKRKLEALEEKQRHAAIARIQARFRGLKDRALNKGRFA